MIHLDGKIMTDNCRASGDTLAVICSGNTVECLQGKLLSANRINNGSGETQSIEVLTSIDNWGIRNCVVRLNFETTSSNTGLENGSIKKIEDKLGKSTLWNACRHHISEIYIKSAYDTLYDDGTSPFYKMFDEFNDHWHKLDKTNFHELPSARHDNSHKQSIISFCQDQLTRFHSRADYKECLHLALVVLGHCPEN